MEDFELEQQNCAVSHEGLMQNCDVSLAATGCMQPLMEF